MELFRLFGSILVDNDKANKSIQKTDNEASKLSNKLGGVFSAVGKTVMTGAVVASTAIAGITKSATDAYAEYEQLVGGVETLFGDSAKELLSYADVAYRTAGLSANEYMSTVTNFSASLISSLGGDTEKASKIANKAIIDMSDNANKMGTSMESIQNAYQGFAKQNYTMLDNLKLGYGGTKTEMQRLLKTANEINEKQGIYTDYSIENFSDIVEAIHVVQEEMGITGTTAEEAMGTIEGSLAMVKASWENVLIGISSGNENLGATIGTLVDSIGAFLDNLIPRIGEIMSQIPLLISELAPMLVEVIWQFLPMLITTLTELIFALVPSLTSALINMFNVVVNGIDPNSTISALLLPTLKSLQDGLNNLGHWCDTYVKPSMDNLKTSLKNLWETLSNLFKDVKIDIDISGLLEDAMKLLGKAIDIVSNAVDKMNELIKSSIDWMRENKTTIELLAIAIGTLTASVVAYNIAQAIKNAGGIAEIAQLGIMTVQVYALDVAQKIATISTTAFGVAVNFLTSPITLVILAIGALIAVGVALYQNWDTIKAKCSELAQSVSNKFEEIKNSIKTKIDDAKTFVGNTIEKIKGFFDFEWSLPKLKLPHVSISGSFSLVPPRTPSFSVDWYAKAMDDGMIMDVPTIFGINKFGQPMAGGEAGSETVVGTQSLMDMIVKATSDNNSGVIQALMMIVERLSEENLYNVIVRAIADGGFVVELDGREIGRLVKSYA